MSWSSLISLLSVLVLFTRVVSATLPAARPAANTAASLFELLLGVCTVCCYYIFANFSSELPW